MKEEGKKTVEVESLGAWDLAYIPRDSINDAVSG